MSILKLNSEHWVCPEVGMPLSPAVLAEPLPLGTWSTGTMEWFPYKVMWRGCRNQQGGWEMGGCWNSDGNVASWWMLVCLGSEVFLSFEDLGHPLLAWLCNRTFSCCLYTWRILEADRQTLIAWYRMPWCFMHFTMPGKEVPDKALASELKSKAWWFYFWESFQDKLLSSTFRVLKILWVL